MKEARSILLRMKHESTKTKALLALDAKGAAVAPLIAKLANSAALSMVAAEALVYLYICTQDGQVMEAITAVRNGGTKSAQRAMRAYMLAINAGGPLI